MNDHVPVPEAKRMVVLYDGQYGIHNDRLHLGALGFRFVVHFPSDRITNSEKQIKGD